MPTAHPTIQRRVTLVLLFTALLVPVGGPMKAAERPPDSGVLSPLEQPSR